MSVSVSLACEKGTQPVQLEPVSERIFWLTGLNASQSVEEKIQAQNQAR
jgi:hypothetical protein